MLKGRQRIEDLDTRYGFAIAAEFGVDVAVSCLREKRSEEVGEIIQKVVQ